MHNLIWSFLQPSLWARIFGRVKTVRKSAAMTCRFVFLFSVIARGFGGRPKQSSQLTLLIFIIYVPCHAGGFWQVRRVPEGHPARPAKEFDTSEFLLSKNERVKKFRAANNPRLCFSILLARSSAQNAKCIRS